MKGAIGMHKPGKLIGAISILCVSTFCFASYVAAQDTTKSDAAIIKVNPASKARIEFLSDTWDFGSIPKGAIVLHNFKLKNVGTDTLIINDVKPTCGCTTAPLSDSNVAPGNEARITATFNTKNFNGRVTKQIFVDSSDPIKPYLKLIFSATINNPLLTIVPSPTEADFGSIRIGAPSQLKITISNDDKNKADLAIVEESAPSMVKPSLTKSSISPKGTTELVLDLLPQTKAGVITESITLEAGNIAGSRFTIPWKAVITQ
jgi:hypothetical protein